MNCQHCGKDRSLHKSVTWNCPLGSCHPVLGYTMYARGTFKVVNPVFRGAVITGRYRYSLWRIWDQTLPSCTWIMLNPSTADAEMDDPTIRRCMAFAKSWGCGGIYVVNLFAFRATDPQALKSATGDICGPDNEHWVREAISAAKGGPIVAAWGTHGRFRDEDQRMMYFLRMELDVQVQCLGRTKDGHPRHPLYVSAATKLEPFR